jgi:hypothetical protein
MTKLPDWVSWALLIGGYVIMPLIVLVSALVKIFKPRKHRQ